MFDVELKANEGLLQGDSDITIQVISLSLKPTGGISYKTDDSYFWSFCKAALIQPEQVILFNVHKLK